MVDSLIEAAFDRYAMTADHRERQQAFTELVTHKALPKRSNDRRFSVGISAWIEALHDASALDEVRLLAIAELVRANQVVKSKDWTEKIRAEIVRTLATPIAPARLLKDADERLNLARALGMAPQAGWVIEYAAQSIVDEDTGEKSRSEFFSVLFAQASSLPELFNSLAKAFELVRFETESPGDSVGKRLSRTLAALRPVLLSSLLEAGEGTGGKLEGVMRAAMRHAGKPKDEKVQIDLTREVALTLHDLVRTRFSLATEAETFAALRICRGFYSSILWPVDVRQVMELLVQDISEALLMLGRQNVPQQDLLEQLDLVCGSKERAKAVAAELADRHLELPERIRDWLRRGRLVTHQQASSVLQDSLLEANDGALGLALIEVTKLAAAEDTLQRIVGTVEVYEPSLMRATSAYAQQVSEVVASVRDVAARRGIRLLGFEGEEIEFMPKFFDLLKPLDRPRVVVKRPAIVRETTQQSSAEVVMKGLVE